MVIPFEWTPEQIADAIRGDITEYEKLKTRLSASGDEAERIRLHKFDKVTAIANLKKELVDRGRSELWEEFIEWEKSLS
jgi:acetyl-CoA carboxylase carboxyltransferase component